MGRIRWQNLNESRRELLFGRGWLGLGEGAGRYPPRSLGMEWRVGRFLWMGLTFTLGGDERDYTVAIGVGFASLYIHASGFREFGALPRGFGRDYGVQLWGDDLHLVLEWACDDSSWNSKTGAAAHGWQRSWFLLDVLLGRAKYTRGEAHVSHSAVVMPEASYPCTVDVRLDTWKRPRWPWAKRIWRAEVDVPGGVPVPGKGENSWDCGEDAIYSLTCPAWTAPEAVAKLRDSAMRRRQKYGGRDWRPTQGAA